jgi:hypothetical protein
LYRVRAGEKPTVADLFPDSSVGNSLPAVPEPGYFLKVAASPRLLGAAAQLVEIFPEGYGYQLY